MPSLDLGCNRVTESSLQALVGFKQMRMRRLKTLQLADAGTKELPTGQMSAHFILVEILNPWRRTMSIAMKAAMTITALMIVVPLAGSQDGKTPPAKEPPAEVIAAWEKA